MPRSTRGKGHDTAPKSTDLMNERVPAAKKLRTGDVITMQGNNFEIFGALQVLKAEVIKEKNDNDGKLIEDVQITLKACTKGVVLTSSYVRASAVDIAVVQRAPEAAASIAVVGRAGGSDPRRTQNESHDGPGDVGKSDEAFPGHATGSGTPPSPSHVGTGTLPPAAYDAKAPRDLHALPPAETPCTGEITGNAAEEPSRRIPGEPTDEATTDAALGATHEAPSAPSLLPPTNPSTGGSPDQPEAGMIVGTTVELQVEGFGRGFMAKVIEEDGINRLEITEVPQGIDAHARSLHLGMKLKSTDPGFSIAAGMMPVEVDCATEADKGAAGAAEAPLAEDPPVELFSDFLRRHPNNLPGGAHLGHGPNRCKGTNQ